MGAFQVLFHHQNVIFGKVTGEIMTLGYLFKTGKFSRFSCFLKVKHEEYEDNGILVVIVKAVIGSVFKLDDISLMLPWFET